MHELSLVMNIIDIANEQVRTHSAREVESIELEIGSIAGVEMAAFRFAWDAAIPRTVLAKAKCIIHPVRALTKCTACNLVYSVQELFEACPECGGFSGHLLQGKELRVKSLIVS